MKTFFCNRIVDKNEMKRLIKWVLLNYGTEKATRFVEHLKTMGFHYATEAGISLSIDDLRVPPVKVSFIENAERDVFENQKRYLRAQITAVEKLEKALDVWNTTNDILKNEVIQHFKNTDIFNPVYMMAFSGARGNISQVRQLVGMRGLMADPQGQILDFPIRRNFREGLTVTEYMISCYGARKGLVDTALRTANSGYLTRRLVDVAQSVIIQQQDCQTVKGLQLSPQQNKHFEKSVIGRVLLRDAVNETNGRILGRQNQDISPQLASLLSTLPSIHVRSPLTCRFNVVCQLCYGWNLSQQKLVQLGEAVGVLAAQSIGEPGTQLTMRTFHTGGVFAGEATQKVYSPHSGKVYYASSVRGRKILTRYGETAFLLYSPLKIKIVGYYSSIIEFSPFSILFISPGQVVSFHHPIAELSSLEPQKKSLQFELPKISLDTSTKDILTQDEGQVHFDRLSTSTKTFEQPGSKLGSSITKTHGSGFIWLLSGQFIYLKEPRILTGDVFVPSVHPFSLREKTPIQRSVKDLHLSWSLQRSIFSFFSKQFLLRFSKKKGPKKLNENSLRFVREKRQISSLKQKFLWELYAENFCVKLSSLSKQKYSHGLDKSTFQASALKYEIDQITNGEKSQVTFKGISIKNQGNLEREVCTERLKIGTLLGNLKKKYLFNLFLPCVPHTKRSVRRKDLSCWYQEEKGFVPLKNDDQPIPYVDDFYLDSTFSKRNSSKIIPAWEVETSSPWDFMEPIPVSKDEMTAKELFSFKQIISVLEFHHFLLQILEYKYLFRRMHRLNGRSNSTCLNFGDVTLLQSPAIGHLSPSTGLIFPFHNQKLDFSSKQGNQNGKLLKHFFSKVYYPPFMSISLNKRNLLKMISKRSLLPTRFELKFDIRAFDSRLSVYSPHDWIKRVDFNTYFFKFNSKTAKRRLKTHEVRIQKPTALSLASRNQGAFILNTGKLKFQLGDFIRVNDELSVGTRSPISGQILRIQQGHIIIRKVQPYLISDNSSVLVKPGQLVKSATVLASLISSQSKTGDIVQGLPKVDELLEARDPLNSPNNLHNLLNEVFMSYRLSLGFYKGSQKAFDFIRKVLVDEVQAVYLDQGVFIADKHVEIIVRQMTNKVVIYNPGDSAFLPGDIVELSKIGKLEKEAVTPMQYKPILLGITRASLNSESFISAASFQETKRVLARAALEGRIDWLGGLKENVILGRLIPAGTGFYTS